MPRHEMLTVFTYDIGAHKTRRQVSKILENELTRVQYSVFEGRLGQSRTEILSQNIAGMLIVAKIAVKMQAVA